MDSQARRSLSLVELVSLVVGVAVSLGSVRLYADRLPHAYTWSVFYHQYVTEATLFLIPITLVITALSMARTPRSRWLGHPAIVVGLSLAAATVTSTSPWLALYAQKFQPDWPPVAALAPVYFIALRDDVGKLVVAAVLGAMVAGRMRGPLDWLEASGWVLGACWVGVWVGTAWADAAVGSRHWHYVGATATCPFFSAKRSSGVPSWKKGDAGRPLPTGEADRGQGHGLLPLESPA